MILFCKNYYIEFFCRIVSLVLKLYLLFFLISNSSKLPLSPTLPFFSVIEYYPAFNCINFKSFPFVPSFIINLPISGILSMLLLLLATCSACVDSTCS